MLRLRGGRRTLLTTVLLPVRDDDGGVFIEEFSQSPLARRRASGRRRDSGYFQNRDQALREILATYKQVAADKGETALGRPRRVSQGDVASKIGIARRTLIRGLKRFGISWPPGGPTPGTAA